MNQRKFRLHVAQRDLSLNEIRNIEESLLQALIEKAKRYLEDDIYHAPTPSELKALRKSLGLTIASASKRIGKSPRTWANREEADRCSHMTEEEFALVILKLIRATEKWPQISPVCIAKYSLHDAAPSQH